MGNTLEVMEKRASSRKYKADLVPDEIVEKIVKAGTHAATGMGKQAPVILVIKNKEVRGKIQKMNAEFLGHGGFDPFYGAPEIIVVLADRSVVTYLYDGTLVMGNMMNACEDLGVDCCWIHRAKEVFDTEEGKEILRSAGIEGDYEGIGNLIIGYDDGGKKEKAPRKADYIHWIR